MANGSNAPLDRSQQQLLIFTLGLSFLMVLLRVGVQRQAGLLPMLYIGVPTVLAIVVILSPSPAALLGRYLKIATLAILEVGIVFGEQFAYFLAIAPVIYLIVIVLALMSGERKSAAEDRAKASTAPVIPPLPPVADRQSVYRRKLVLVGVVLSFTIISLGYRVLVLNHLETTSLLFVGIPTAIALLLVLTVRPQSAMASAMAGVTLVLLLSAILFGEGLICILMTAPLAYIVGAIVGGIIDAANRGRRTASMLLLAPIVLMSLEGTHAHISFPREQVVTSRAVVAATPEQVQAALAAEPRFRAPLPYYLRMSFPRPVYAHGDGLRLGDRRVIHFAGGEGHPGDLTMEVSALGPRSVTFRALSDRSKIAHWLAWEETEVAWRPLDAGHTEVSWTLRYRRGLDPLWYFEPWERYAVGLAGDYLIANVATPGR